MTTYSHGVEKNNGKELRRKKNDPPPQKNPQTKRGD